MSEANPFLQESTGSYNKSVVPLLGLQKAFDQEFGPAQDQWNFDNDGFPAWNQLLTIPINGSFSQYLVPVFKAEDDRVKALILFTHYLDHGVVDVEYVYRGKVSRYPTYNSLRLANKNGITPLRDHTLESLVVKFSALDQQLFVNTYDDLLLLLDEETRNQFYRKDCQITTRYLVLECQDVLGGGQLLYTDCNAVGVETVVTVIAGCNGGTGGPGNPGPSGPTTGGSGTGGGVSVVNTDPGSRDNRCIEDEVDCDDEEEEEDDDDDERFDRIIIFINPEDFPCASATVNELFGNGDDAANPIVQILEGVFNDNANVNLTISTHPDVATQAGYPSGSFIPGAFFPGPAGFSTNGTFYFQGSIQLDEDYLHCTNDFIRATVIHESIHGYLRQQRSLLGDTEYLDRYPIDDFSSANLDEHIVMSNIYVDSIASVLLQYNPSLPPFVRTLIAWSGLTDTPAYANFRDNHPNYTPAQIDNTLDALTIQSGLECGAVGNDTLQDFNFQMCNN